MTLPDMPLVLHGGSGIFSRNVVESYLNGCFQANINTECQIAFAEATRSTSKKLQDKEGKALRPRKLLLHLVHKPSQIQLKKSSIGSVHQKLNT